MRNKLSASLLIIFYGQSFLASISIKTLEERNAQFNKAIEGTEYYNSNPTEKINSFTLAAQLSSLQNEWGYFDCYSFQSPMTIQMDYFIVEELTNSVPLPLKNEIKNLAYTTMNEMPHDHYLYRNTINHLLLTGPSGSGKTSLALAIACQTGRDFLLMPPGSLSNRFKYSPFSILNNLFYTAMETKRPLIIIFDEVSALTDITCPDFDPILVDHFCSKLDESKKNPNLLIILIAKDYSKLPQAIKERFAHSLYPMPKVSYQRREQILKHYLQDQCKMDPKLLKKLVEQTEGLNIRELSFLVKTAQNNLFSRTQDKGYKTKECMQPNDIATALQLIRANNVDLSHEKTTDSYSIKNFAKPCLLSVLAFLAGFYINTQLSLQAKT